VPVIATPTSALRAWSWQASCHGVDNDLVDPVSGTPARAVEVVAELLNCGSGARRQCEVYAAAREVRDVVSFALGVTHREGAANYVEW